MKISDTINFFMGSSHYERKKILWITLAFFCIIGCYTILREMRDALFMTLVGKSFIQYAQIISMILLIPALFCHSRLVDRFSKFQLFYVYSILYTLLIGCTTYFLVCRGLEGMGNYRFLPWVFYVLVEGYAPFVISIMYAFINSTTTPQAISHTYSLVIAGSKVGGMVTAGIAWLFLQNSLFTDTGNICSLLVLAALSIICVPFLIRYLQQTIPEKYLHGYEASYRVNKMIDKEVARQPWYKTIITGPLLMVRYPYVFGIFLLVFCWEVVSAVINYNRLCFGAATCINASQLSAFLFGQIFWVHTFAMIISLFGVRIIVGLFGERKTLAFIPIITGLCIIGYYTSSLSIVITICYILLRSINYSLAVSAREALYIPTTKEVRYKSKAWIDAFGTKIARGSGALYNLGQEVFKMSASFFGALFCMSIIAVWYIVAKILGKRFEHVIHNNEVIGNDKSVSKE